MPYLEAIGLRLKECEGPSFLITTHHGASHPCHLGKLCGLLLQFANTPPAHLTKHDTPFFHGFHKMRKFRLNAAGFALYLNRDNKR